MLKHISILILTSLFAASCNVVKAPKRKQTSAEFLASQKNEKWMKFAEKLGIKGEVSKSKEELIKDLGKNGLSSLLGLPKSEEEEVSQEIWADNLTNLIDKHWDKTAKGTDEEEADCPFSNLMAEDLRIIGTAEDKNFTKLYTIEYKVKGFTNYAYLAFPDSIAKDQINSLTNGTIGKNFGAPLLYLHKDDVGLSWDMMVEALGKDLLSKRIVVAPAGPGEALISEYEERTEPTEDKILYQSNHEGALAWSDDADDAFSLIRTLLYPDMNAMMANPDPEPKNWGPIVYLASYSSWGEKPVADIIGFSKGGLTAAITIAKGTYVSKPSFEKYLLGPRSEGKPVDSKGFRESITPGKIVFFNKLVTVGAPLTFIHGPFRLIVKDCITGAIKGTDYESYPGLRSLMGLFDEYKQAKSGSEEEESALATLVSETLTRDFMFLAPYVAGSMSSKYFDKKSADFNCEHMKKPRIAFLHHKNDGMIPRNSNRFVRDLFENKAFKTGLKKAFGMEYNHLEHNLFKSFANRDSVKFHLQAPFWSSTNKNQKSPRTIIDEILNSLN